MRSFAAAGIRDHDSRDVKTELSGIHVKAATVKH